MGDVQPYITITTRGQGQNIGSKAPGCGKSPKEILSEIGKNKAYVCAANQERQERIV